MAQNKSMVTLDSLILPGTPPQVSARYRTLAERAKTIDFGPLEEDFVMLDTETTGLSFRDCELIEIAAARISNKGVVDRLQTFVNPGRPIPPEIQRLTGIRAIDVADAPRAEEAVAQLADFVAGCPVVAHNATFDRTFIEKVPGGREVSDTWIDSLALSRIALPRLKSHRLSDMAEVFGCDSVTHRAMDDVDALCGMWPVMLAALCDLPQGLMDTLARMHDEVEWPFRPLFAYLAQEFGTPDEGFSLKVARHELLGTVEGHARADAAELEAQAPLTAPSRAQIQAAFATDGLVARMYDVYERRSEQEAMALEVRDALATSTHRAIEAGTGVGKSMAYLVPAITFAQQNGITIGVATKTNALTDQLVSHELPALDAVLPGGVSYVSLKGYDHYPCLNRLQRATMQELPLDRVAQNRWGESPDQEMLTALAVTYANVCQSVDGDLDTLGIRWRFVPRSMLATTAHECQRTRCPFFPNECMVHGARRRAASADVVVTNHSLLLRNVDVEGHILPPIRHWIVDEAHGFEAEARRQWAVEVTGDAARQGFEKLGGAQTGTIHTLFGQLNGKEGATLPARLLTKLAASASRAQVAMADLFETLHELKAAAGPSGGYDTQTLWIDDAVRQTPEWAALSEAMVRASERLAQAAKDAAEATEALADVAPQLGTDLREASGFLVDLNDALTLINEGEDHTYVYSARLTRHKRDIASEALIAEKVDVGSDLAARWLPEMMSVTFTSATIAVGNSFEHFDRAVGLNQLERNSHKSLQLDSSFDFDHNMSVVVCRDMPAPGTRGYLEALEDLLYDVHVSMGGSVLTLFTNRREMERVHEALAPRLAAAGLEVDCQERGSSPRRLRERFMADKSRSLMALRSFWEGFDAAGDTLRCVVITKLPFANPNDPLVRERDLREERAWWRYSLPEAVLSVKQAAGRLIRTANDSGVVVFADSRVASKRYGQQFVRSMPSNACMQLDCENVGRFIQMWRSSRER